ncbi:hypothetical protein D3C87_716010 [compost metagenome]
MKVAVPSASFILAGVAAILSVAVLLSVIFMLAGVLLTVTSAFAEVANVAITVSVPSTRASANTGMVMVPVV